MNEGFEDLERKNEYLENQSRRNNIKITGVQEEEKEKIWDDTEVIVKNFISDILGIERELRLRALTTSGRSTGTSPNAAMMVPPRKSPEHIGPSSQRFSQKTIKKTSSKLQEKETQRFRMGDFSKRTSERIRSKIPDVLEARRNGKQHSCS